MPENVQHATHAAIAVIEQHMLERIKVLDRDYIATVASYTGELDAKHFAQTVQRFPAIWVTFEKADAKQKTSRATYFDYTFSVVVAARSVRAEVTARHGVFDKNGKRLSVGSYELLGDVEKALLTQPLTLTDADGNQSTSHFRAGNIRTVFNTQFGNEAVSVLAWRWSINNVIVPAPREADAPYIHVVDVDYNAPSAGSTNDLAGDTVTLADNP